MKTTIITIVTLHLIFFFVDFTSQSTQKSPKKSLIVQTFRSPPIQKVRSQPASKAPYNQPTPLLKNSESEINKQKLLNDLSRHLSQIEPIEEPKGTLSSPPPLIPLFEIDHMAEEEITDYFVLIASHLKEALELPEHGEVKLELTVRKTGQIRKLRILHASSEKNQRYLELTLPVLTLPPFTDDLKNELEHTFTLRFCNEN